MLEDRARRLAQVPQTAAPVSGAFDAVEFRLAYENYAIEACHIREIWPLKDYRPLPGTPGFVLGLINLRGELLSVIDIRKFFGLPLNGLTDLNRVLVLQSRQMEVGILADSITGMRRISPQELQPGAPAIAGVRAGFTKGVTRDLLVLLDGAKILSDAGILVGA